MRSASERYARGELTDEAFEARVERLLETESVAGARSSVERRRADRDAASSGDRERA